VTRRKRDVETTARPPMADTDYARAQELLIACARLLGTVDWEAFLERIDIADAVVPVTDPSLYRSTVGEVDKIRWLARHARQLAGCELPGYFLRHPPDEAHARTMISTQFALEALRKAGAS
jgi:hypothetical protein